MHVVIGLTISCNDLEINSAKSAVCKETFTTENKIKTFKIYLAF